LKAGDTSLPGPLNGGVDLSTPRVGHDIMIASATTIGQLAGTISVEERK
jgi:hypothetical protein